MVIKAHLNILLDIMIIMSLNHYVWSFLKRLGMLKRFKNGNKTILFKIIDKKSLKRYNKVWRKVSSLIKIKFDSAQIYDNEYIKTKIKWYEDIINTKFYDGIRKRSIERRFKMQMSVKDNTRFC